MLAGQVIVGGSVSKTVTVKVQLAAPNSDCETIEWVPTGKNDPEPGVLVTEPQSPFTTAAENVTKAPNCSSSVVSAVTTTFAGQSSVHVPADPPSIIKLAEARLLS